MLNNEAVIHYLVEYHATRDYFECHEIMEEYWKLAPKDEYSNLWLGFIQVAVAQYHDRRGNITGASRLYYSALTKLKSYIDRVSEINMANLCQQIEQRAQYITQPFYDINFDIVSEQLYMKCQSYAQANKLVWGTASNQVSQDIINRHIVRDRTEVIQNRKQALLRKQQNK